MGRALYWNKMTVNFQEFPSTKRKNKYPKKAILC